MDGVAHLLARCTFPEPGSRVTCAVSGGADSLALLVLAVEAGCAATAIHVDHGLRPGSAGEAAVVADAAERFGAGFRAETVQVEQGPNLEERARRARYGVLPPDVLTGHTADDQAETVLLNLLRGAGPEGLAGIEPRRRPILGLRRTETAELCIRVGLEPVVDPSNTDPRFRRNRVRHELLPLLDAIADRDVAPVLARQARLHRDTVELLEAQAAVLDPCDARTLCAAPVALGRLAVRRWIRVSTGAEHPPDAACVERVLAVARGEAVATEVGSGWRVERHAQRLSIGRAAPVPDHG